MEPQVPQKIGSSGIWPFGPDGMDFRSEWTKTAGGGAFAFPFEISVGTATFTVRYGTVEDIAPTDIATPIAWTDDATNTIYLDCTLDADGFVTAAAVSVSTTGVPADTYDHAYKLIGEVIVADGVVTTVNQSLMFSQGFQACNRDPEDPETTPGSYQFFVT
jgi:hypothetical protein